MKIVRSLVRTSAAVACGALVLSLLAGDAMAGKKPPEYLLWPSGAEVVANARVVSAGGGTRFGMLGISWPITNGADHYRVTVVEKVKRVSTTLYDQSPAYYTPSEGVAYYRSSVYLWPSVPFTYIITVTAYSDPDETVAYSESLQAQISIH
jgi:hypothetical protein